MPSENEGYRQELREAVRGFVVGQSAPSGPVAVATAQTKHINVYLFGPQGSGKTSFIRSCFHALYGSRYLARGLDQAQQHLHRSDDGTTEYSVYALTDFICLHDTRGQREYTPLEMQQLKLVLEGRARPNALIQQRKRYWVLLREFWRSDEQMQRTFSGSVMMSKASLETEPHFVFLVLDPNQQELLLEDRDFQECYSCLLGDFSDRGVPHALLCTHGDTLTSPLRSALLQLPAWLNCRPPKAFGVGSLQRPASAQLGPVRPGGGHTGSRWSPAPPPEAPAPFGNTSSGAGLRMPDIMRIVSNYTADDPRSSQRAHRASPVPVERDAEGNDVMQDIHTLLVLLDALRQADNHITQRASGSRPAPMPMEAEQGCPLL